MVSRAGKSNRKAKGPMAVARVCSSTRRALFDDLRTLPPGQLVAGIAHIERAQVRTSGFLPLIHSRQLPASRLSNSRFSFANGRHHCFRYLVDQTVLSNRCHQHAVVPLSVAAYRVLEPHHGVRISRSAIAEEHSRCRNNAVVFATKFSARIIEARLCPFVFHRAITGRMDIDRGVGIALFATNSRKDVVRKFVNRLELTDNFQIE